MVTLYPTMTVVCSQASTTEQYRVLTSAQNVLEALQVLQAVVRIDSMDANFRCRLGVRRALDKTSWSAIDWPASADASTYVSAAGTANEKLWRFDPNATGKGDIDNNAAVFQVVLGYSTSSGAAMATVTIDSLSWR